MQLVKTPTTFVDVTNHSTVSDVVAERIQQVRQKRGWTVKQLAEQCAAAGAPELTAHALYNIGNGRRDEQGNRRRFVTVDELLTLALVLEVAPVYLLVPTTPAPDYPLPVDATEQLTMSRVWERFIRGEAPLPGMDAQNFLSEVPREEFRAVMDRIVNEGRGDDGPGLD